MMTTVMIISLIMATVMTMIRYNSNTSVDTRLPGDCCYRGRPGRPAWTRVSGVSSARIQESTRPSRATIAPWRTRGCLCLCTWRGGGGRHDGVLQDIEG